MDVIRNLRHLLKRKSDIQKCDVKEVIADAMQLLSPEANRRNIDLCVNAIQRALQVRADPVHLQQVILNLVANAMDAMTDTPQDARKITIQQRWRGTQPWEFLVSNSGKGIPEHKLDEVFKTFYTTKEQGTGLGLLVARTIVETYEGKSGQKIRWEAVPYFASLCRCAESQQARMANMRFAFLPSWRPHLLFRPVARDMVVS